jgi:hypothetical protein
MIELTNKEAANILKHIVSSWQYYPRANGKTTVILYQLAAMMKAIELLEETPDERRGKFE